MELRWTSSRTLSILLALAVAGCGGRSSSSSPALSSTATAAPVTSGGGGGGPSSGPSAIALRPLDRGIASGVRTTPPTSGAWRAASTQADLDALWREHQGQRPVPDPVPVVDFASERVVALFLGERPTTGYGIEVVSVADVASAGAAAVEVSYVVSVPPPGARVAPGPTWPFDFVAVNRPRGALTFRDVTPPVAPPPPPAATAIDAHGELVTVPTLAGGQTLGFLPDGAQAAHEVSDARAILAAGGHAGYTLQVQGDVDRNVGGATSLATAVRVVTFALDDIATTVRVVTGTGAAPHLRDVEGRTWDAVGPLAGALLASPAGRPLRVTGHVDAAHAPVSGPGLVATSFRPAVELSVHDLVPLASVSNFDVDDLEGTGGYRASSFLALGPRGDARSGCGRKLALRTLLDLRRAVAAAGLPAQPREFRPAQIHPDHPVKTIHFADAANDVDIRIWGGATVPPELQAILDLMERAQAGVPTLRSLERGQQSQAAAAATLVARDQAAWDGVYTHHTGGPANGPTVDFQRELGLGVFLGQRPTGGHDVEVRRLERIGDALHLTVQRTAPSGPAIQVITSPYEIAVVTHQGLGAEVYVDGVRR